jgi:hypothetical protein
LPPDGTSALLRFRPILMTTMAAVPGGLAAAAHHWNLCRGVLFPLFKQQEHL